MLLLLFLLLIQPHLSDQAPQAAANETKKDVNNITTTTKATNLSLVDVDGNETNLLALDHHQTILHGGAKAINLARDGLDMLLEEIDTNYDGGATATEASQFVDQLVKAKKAEAIWYKRLLTKKKDKKMISAAQFGLVVLENLLDGKLPDAQEEAARFDRVRRKLNLCANTTHAETCIFELRKECTELEDGKRMCLEPYGAPILELWPKDITPKRYTYIGTVRVCTGSKNDYVCKSNLEGDKLCLKTEILKLGPDGTLRFGLQSLVTIGDTNKDGKLTHPELEKLFSQLKHPQSSTSMTKAKQDALILALERIESGLDELGLSMA